MENRKLKEAVSKLNKAGIEGLEPIEMIGIKKTDLVELYLSGVELAADTGQEAKLPENVVSVYNELVKETSDTAETAKQDEDQEEVAPKEEKPKKEKAKKEKKEAKPKAEPKAKKPLSRYGHIQSAGSGKLDDLLWAGKTVQAMMDETGFPRTRIVGHVKHLINDLGVKVTETKPNGDNTKLVDIHYKAEQERI